MDYHLFPKFFQHLDVERLMESCAVLGVTGPTVLVRQGFWTDPDHLARDVPPFVAAAARHGLRVTVAVTDFPLSTLAENDAPLRTFADQGIRFVRAGLLARNAVKDVRALADHLRRLAEAAARSAERAGVRLLLQLHGGCYPHNATAGYGVVRGLNPAHVGIMVDPGNNIHQEGFETWSYQMQLLREYIGACGIKDARWARDGDAGKESKGWRPEWVAADEGQINWVEVFRHLRAVGFDGPGVVMPFYDSDRFEVLFEKAKLELAYLRQCSGDHAP